MCAQPIRWQGVLVLVPVLVLQTIVEPCPPPPLAQTSFPHTLFPSTRHHHITRTHKYYSSCNETGNGVVGGVGCGWGVV